MNMLLVIAISLLLVLIAYLLAAVTMCKKFREEQDTLYDKVEALSEDVRSTQKVIMDNVNKNRAYIIQSTGDIKLQIDNIKTQIDTNHVDLKNTIESTSKKPVKEKKSISSSKVIKNI